MKHSSSYTIRRVSKPCTSGYEGMWCVTIVHRGPCGSCSFLYCKTRAGAREAVKRMKGVQ